MRWVLVNLLQTISRVVSVVPAAQRDMHNAVLNNTRYVTRGTPLIQSDFNIKV